MKRLIAAIWLILCFGMGAVIWYEQPYTFQGKPTNMILSQDIANTTVATMQALGCSALTDPDIYIVTDGSTITDCETGSGTFTHFCRCDHTNWVDAGTPNVECFRTNISNPVNADQFVIDRAQTAWTFHSINCIVDPHDPNASELVDLVLYQTASDGDITDLATNGIDGATAVSCTQQGASDDGNLSNAEIPAGRWIGMDIGTVTGTVTMLNLQYCMY